MKFKEEHDCSENQISQFVEDFFKKNLSRPLYVLLEGPMGSGKSTLARNIIQYFSIEKSTQSKGVGGSPTYPLMQIYSLSDLEIVHIDFYRFKSEQEIFESGIEEVLWQNGTMMLSGSPSKRIFLLEWTSLWSELYKALCAKKGLPKSAEVFVCEINFSNEQEDKRKFLFQRQ